MATLPLLKSGQIAQYPFQRSLKCAVETIGFLDGTEQRCATARPLHEWTVQLGQIDEEELAELEAFVEQQQGAAGEFSFTDPVDGTQYNNCSLVLDVLTETLRSQGRALTTLTIRENPN
jgi:phage-related protein